MIDDNDTLTITITGNLTIARADLEHLMRRLLAGTPPPQAVTPLAPRSTRPAEVERGVPRMAWTVEETTPVECDRL